MMKSRSNVIPLPQDPQIIAPRVIGLSGLAGCGKSTVAGFLAQHGYARERFAGGLKAMMSALLAYRGMDPADIMAAIEGEEKEVECAHLLDRTPRHAMQTLGTDWGRNMMHPDFWIDVAYGRMIVLAVEGCRFAMDDVRFQNEADLIRNAFDGEIWRIERPGVGLTSGHSSEVQDVSFDRVIQNDGCLDHLEAQVLEALFG